MPRPANERPVINTVLPDTEEPVKIISDTQDEPLKAGEIQIRIVCLLGSCKGPKELIRNIYPEYLCAFLLLHHTNHEGHTTEIFINGKALYGYS